MNFTKFLVYTFFGSLPWSFLLTYAGLKLGQNWEDIKPWFHRLDLVVVLGLAVVLLYLWRNRKNIL